MTSDFRQKIVIWRIWRMRNENLAKRFYFYLFIVHSSSKCRTVTSLLVYTRCWSRIDQNYLCQNITKTQVLRQEHCLNPKNIKMTPFCDRYMIKSSLFTFTNSMYFIVIIMWKPAASLQVDGGGWWILCWLIKQQIIDNAGSIDFFTDSYYSGFSTEWVQQSIDPALSMICCCHWDCGNAKLSQQ